MKIRRILLSGAVACLFSAATVCAVFATPAFAQAPDPAAERYFQKYLAANPEVRRNPGLMSDPRWLNAHPSFHKFLKEHPNVARQAHQMGAYGENQENEWYQGQQGRWRRQGNSWQWKSTHGDQWFQGRQGHWYRERNGWRWYGNDGDEYRQGRNGWQWYGKRQKARSGLK